MDTLSVQYAQKRFRDGLREGAERGKYIHKRAIAIAIQAKDGGASNVHEIYDRNRKRLVRSDGRKGHGAILGNQRKPRDRGVIDRSDVSEYSLDTPDKMTMRANALHQAKVAKSTKSPRGFAAWCKRQGIDPKSV